MLDFLIFLNVENLFFIFLMFMCVYVGSFRVIVLLMLVKSFVMLSRGVFLFMMSFLMIIYFLCLVVKFMWFFLYGNFILILVSLFLG